MAVFSTNVMKFWALEDDTVIVLFMCPISATLIWSSLCSCRHPWSMQKNKIRQQLVLVPSIHQWICGLSYHSCASYLLLTQPMLSFACACSQSYRIVRHFGFLYSRLHGTAFFKYDGHELAVVQTWTHARRLCHYGVLCGWDCRGRREERV